MHDLRYDQEAADAATHAALRGKTFVTPTIDTAQQLRTVPMPDLRSADARTLDAAARNLDTRTFDQQVVAELVRIVDALQGVSLRLEVIEGLIVELAKAAGIPEVHA